MTANDIIQKMAGRSYPSACNDRSCTPQELTSIITFPSGGYYEYPHDSYNEVYENLFLGDSEIAHNKPLLRRLKISHVVNAACGKDTSMNLIDTSDEFYRDTNISFYGIMAYDLPNFQISQFFEESADYIDNALQSGGRVLVHCRLGISRSATIILAYLMIKKRMTAQEATRMVRAAREIVPNEGFLEQICALNDKLIASRK